MVSALGVANNRKVSQEQGKEIQIQTLEINDSGLVVSPQRIWLGQGVSSGTSKTKFDISHPPSPRFVCTQTTHSARIQTVLT
jgi:hypothetical protein